MRIDTHFPLSGYPVTTSNLSDYQQAKSQLETLEEELQGYRDTITDNQVEIEKKRKEIEEARCGAASFLYAAVIDALSAQHGDFIFRLGIGQRNLCLGKGRLQFSFYCIHTVFLQFEKHIPFQNTLSADCIHLFNFKIF